MLGARGRLVRVAARSWAQSLREPRARPWAQAGSIRPRFVELLLGVVQFERQHDLGEPLEEGEEADPDQDQGRSSRVVALRDPDRQQDLEDADQSDRATTRGSSPATAGRRRSTSCPSGPAGTPGPTPARRTCSPAGRSPTTHPRTNSTPSAMCTNFHPPVTVRRGEELIHGRAQEHDADQDTDRRDRGRVEPEAR